VLASNFWWWLPLGHWREWDWGSSYMQYEHN
jgi:hypothetical protein